MDENTTVINLDELEKSGHLEEVELIYRDAYDSLCQTIIQKVKRNVEACKKGITDLVSQPCFFINGGRGSGKTTLLRAVRHKLCSENAIEGAKIHELAAIDPTELAETENFFIHILGRVQKNLLDMKSERILNDEDKAHLRNAYTSIRKMSKGLGLLVRRPEDGGNSSDAGFFVQQRVEDCVSGLELKQEFAKLVETLCKLFRVDAMLVTVDDADMNFNKCSEVFETVRKYLINTRMAFVFAGDLKLYAMVVRAMQLNHFGELALSYDTKREEHRFQLLDVLEDQYAMKLFPVENRVELSDFSLVYDNCPTIIYSLPSEAKLREEKMDAFIKGIMSLVFKGQFMQEPWLSYVKKLSTRSALQLLSYWSKHRNDENVVIWWRDGIKKVVMHSLIKLRIGTIESRNMALAGLIQAVTNFVKGTNMGISGAGLQPGMGDASQQMASFYLSAETVCCVRNLYDVLFYILSIFPRIQCGPKLAQYFQDGGSEDNLPQLLQLGADCTAMMLPSMDVKKAQTRYFGNGVVPLFSQHQLVDGSEKERMSVKEFVKELNAVTGKHDDSDTVKFILAINAAFSRVVENGVSIFCVSIYNLIARILVLVRVMLSGEDIKDEHIRNVLVMGFDYVPTAVRGGVVEKSGMLDGFIGYPDASWVDFSFLKDKKYNAAIDAMVEDIKAWGEEVKELVVSAHPVAYYNSWSHLYRDCMLASNEAKLKATNVEDLAGAAGLLSRYIAGMVTSTMYIKCDGEKSLFRVLCNCPLLKVWELEDNKRDKGEVYQKLNSVNIGPVGITISKERAETICDYRMDEQFGETRVKVNNALDALTNDYIVNDVEEWWRVVLHDARERYVTMCYRRLSESKNQQEHVIDSKKIEKWANAFISSFELHELVHRTDFIKRVVDAKKECFSNFASELESRRESLKSSVMGKLDAVDNEDDFERKILSRELGRELRGHRWEESRQRRGLQRVWTQISVDMNNKIAEVIEKRIDENLRRKKW